MLTPLLRLQMSRLTKIEQSLKIHSPPVPHDIIVFKLERHEFDRWTTLWVRMVMLKEFVVNSSVTACW